MYVVYCSSSIAWPRGSMAGSAQEHDLMPTRLRSLPSRKSLFSLAFALSVPSVGGWASFTASTERLILSGATWDRGPNSISERRQGPRVASRVLQSMVDADCPYVIAGLDPGWMCGSSPRMTSRG